jgi:hypothetical protein
MSLLSASVVYCFNFGWIRIDYVALPLMMKKGVSVYLAWITLMLDYFSECANCISHGNTLSKSMHQNVYALAKTSMHQQTALAKTSYNLEWREYIVIYAAQISVLLSG